MLGIGRGHVHRLGLIVLVSVWTIGIVGCDSDSSEDHPLPSRHTATPVPTQVFTHTPLPTWTAIPATPTPAFRVLSVYPQAGAARGGTAVTIDGVGFGAGTNVVRFGGRAATDVIALSDNRISCLSPPGAAGATVDVVVDKLDGRPGQAAGFFQYVQASAGNTLRIDPVGLPQVSFDERIGTTTVLFDYVVRDGLGRPVATRDVDARLFLDGNLLGEGELDESVLGADARELEMDVLLTLVLDASFSLERFSTPQFARTLQSAEELVARGADLWSERAGMFDWTIVWFNELLARPHPDFVDTFRITNIPRPEIGDFTKLYSALSAGLDVSTGLRADGVAAETRDRHVIVVFTDGRDNLSRFDNPGVEEVGRLTNDDPYRRFGWRSTDLDQVLQEIAAHPAYPETLTVHSIALGEPCAGPQSENCFDAIALDRIAQVGFGQQVESPDDASSLFNEILSEFETLESSGAIVALPPGTYSFDVVVDGPGATRGEIGFLFQVLESGARFLTFR